MHSVPRKCVQTTTARAADTPDDLLAQLVFVDGWSRMRLDETVFEVQSYLGFQGVRIFKNKNISHGLFSQYKRQIFATSRTDLRAIPHEVRGDERTIQVAPIAIFMQRKVKHTEYDFFFSVVGH
jgi:hypothetical protein